MHSGTTELKTILHYAGLIVLSIICLTPIYIMISTSFKNEVLIFDGNPVWFFFFPTLQNYMDIIGEANFDRYLVNSIIVSVSATMITLTTGGMAAYSLARMQFPGRQSIANGALLVRMIPPAVLAIPAFAVSILLGIANKLSGLIFFYSALNLPFAIWLLYGFVKQVPIELEEAAVVDGATPWQVFTRVLFPIMKAGYAVTGIFVFRIAWNEFILALLLTDRTTRTLPVATSLFLTDSGPEWGRIMAMGTLIVIPPLIFTFFSARHIIAGITAGAVKG